MKAKIILTFSAIIYMIRGVALLFAPEELYRAYGATLDAVGVWSGHFMGGPFLFICLVNWAAARSVDNSIARNIILANIVFEAISVAFALAGVKLFNSLVWAAIGLDGVLLLGFVYLFFSGLEKRQMAEKSSSST